MYRRMSLKFLSVSALLAVSLAVAPCAALAAPAAGLDDQAVVDLSQTDGDFGNDSVFDADADQDAHDEDVQDVSSDAEGAHVADGVSAEASRNGIPMVTIFVDETWDVINEASSNDLEHAYGGFNDLMSGEHHDMRTLGSVSVDVPEGFVSEFGSSYAPEGELKLEFMRGRGNSTWEAYKKPFKLKFEHKQEFFGMKPAKEWALMASAYDESLLDNRIASWIARQMGLPYTPCMVPVDLVVVRVEDGHEVERIDMGSYYLSELVEVGPNRLDIGKLGDDVTSDNPDDEENITGGYLLSLYHPAQDSSEPDNNVFRLDSSPWLYGRGPEFEAGDLSEGRAKQHDYIYDYLRQVDRLVMGDDYTGTTYVDAKRHNEICAMMDLDGAVDYWWTQVFSRNKDGFLTASTYLYKPRGDKLYWGPSWDFDQGFEREVEGWTYNHAFWLDELCKTDPRFVKMLKERWSDPEDGLNVKMAAFTAPGGPFDAYVSEMRATWEENKRVYPTRTSPFRDLFDGSYDETMEGLRDWIDNRRAWINEHLDEVGIACDTEVAFVNEGEPTLACDGRISYQARVTLADMPVDDFSDSHMTFAIRPNHEGASQAKARVVEVPFDQADVVTDADGRTVATFALPLTSIEMGQTVTSTFSYTDGGEDASIEMEQTLEGQIMSFVEQGGDETRVAYAKALHDFGRTAYDFFAAYGTGSKITDGYSPMGGRFTECFNYNVAWDGAWHTLLDIGADKNLGTSQVKKICMNLRFDSDTTVEFNIYTKQAVQDFAAHATCKGKQVDATKVSDTQYRIRISGLRATDLAELIEIDGDCDGAFSMRCSALSYATAVLEKNAYGNVGNDFMAAMYNYYKAATEIAG